MVVLGDYFVDMCCEFVFGVEGCEGSGLGEVGYVEWYCYFVLVFGDGGGCDCVVDLEFGEFVGFGEGV